MGLLGDLKAYLAEKLDVHITSNGKSKKQIVKNTIKAKKGATVTQNIVVNLPQASETEQSQMLAELAESFNRGEIVFVNDESKRLVDDLQALEASTESGDIVTYFKGKLSSTDWQILRTGLYINNLIQQGMPTGELRQSVIQTYGLRGRNLLNLASSGHFETHIKPLYEELSKSADFTKEKFDEEFETILKEMPFAIFVNTAVDVQKLRAMIDERVTQAKHYSVEKRKIFLHAWGSHVKTVDACIETLDSSLRVTAKKRKEVTEIIDVTIEF